MERRELLKRAVAVSLVPFIAGFQECEIELQPVGLPVPFGVSANLEALVIHKENENLDK